jgi:hypothetical protein
MGTLKCGQIDFNNPQVVLNLNTRIKQELRKPSSYHDLAHTRSYYFSIPRGRLPLVGGWYIILDGSTPLYVGKADNLDRRLNSENGSRDQFANPQRISEMERNFIKKYSETGIVRRLRVAILTEASLYEQQELTDLDRGNTEKHINIWRSVFEYL